MRKPRVLFAAPRLPGPIGGDRLKNAKVIQVLSRHADIHLVCMTGRTTDRSALAALDGHLAGYRVFELAKPRYYRAAANTLRNSKPLQVNYYTHPEVARYIRSKRDDFDLLFCTMVRMGEYASETNGPKVLDMQDSYAQMYARNALEASSRLWRAVYRFEAPRLFSYEEEMLRQFDQVYLWNDLERRALPHPDRATWLPHGVDDRLLGYDERVAGYEDAVVFFGKMDYQPNVDAVSWFASHVLPLLDGMRLVVLGASPSRAILKLARGNSRIEVSGFVPDPYAVIRSACCNVACMQTGGGIQNKVLEAMAVGALVIASPLAARPLVHAIPGTHLLVEESPESYADAILSIRSNVRAYEHVRVNARSYIATRHTWEIYRRRLVAKLSALIPGIDAVPLDREQHAQYA